MKRHLLNIIPVFCIAAILTIIFMVAKDNQGRAVEPRQTRPRTAVVEIFDNYTRSIYLLRVDGKEYIVNEQGGIVEHIK